jgi:hypothetical protein
MYYRLDSNIPRQSQYLPHGRRIRSTRRYHPTKVLPYRRNNHSDSRHITLSLGGQYRHRRTQDILISLDFLLEL